MGLSKHVVAVGLASLGVVLAGTRTIPSNPQYGREAQLKADLWRMRDAIAQFHADKGMYPPTLEDLVTAAYLHEIPTDPITGSTETWKIAPAERGATDSSAEAGVQNVKSGADQRALDGTPYSDWN